MNDGVDVTPDQLVASLYVPGRRGCLQAELLAATRRHGRVPCVLPPALNPLLEELRAGQPVLLLQNLAFDRWPIWHYSVLIGVNPEKQEFLLHSGTENRQRSTARQSPG